MLGVGALGAVEDDLRQVGLRQSARAPLVDALLRVDFRPGLRVLQVEHDERHQGTVLALFEGLAEQALGLAVLGVAGAGLGRQPLAKARAGPRRGLRGLAVELFGLGLLGAVAAGDLHVGEADLGVGVTHRGQGLVVALGGGEVAALQGLLGQALVGQSGAAGGQGDGRGQQQVPGRQGQGREDGHLHGRVPVSERWPGSRPCSAGCGRAGRRC